MTDKINSEWEDHIVAEVRAAREAYAKQFNYDLRAICEDLKRSEEEYKKMGFRFVDRKPKMIGVKTGTDS